MRIAPLLMLGLLLLPSVTAHEGGTLYPLQVATGTVTTEDPQHNFDVLFPEEHQLPGTLWTMSYRNLGPGDLRMTLRGDGVDLVSWTAPGDGLTRLQHHIVTDPTTLTYHIENPSAQNNPRVRFMFDTEGWCFPDEVWDCRKPVVYELEGATVVVPYVVNEAGTYQATLGNSPVHTFETSVWAPDLSNRLTSTAEVDRQGNTVIQWDAPDAGRYHLLVTSTETDMNAYWTAPSSAAAYEALHANVRLDGTVGVGLPSVPAPLLALALLGLALALRRD